MSLVTAVVLGLSLAWELLRAMREEKKKKERNLKRQSNKLPVLERREFHEEKPEIV